MRPDSTRGYSYTVRTGIAGTAGTASTAGRGRISNNSNRAGPRRPVSTRQGYSRPDSYSAAFQAINAALQKAQTRDMAAQACTEILAVISNSVDDCDALNGLISALTARTMRTDSRVERRTITQSLCAVAMQLQKNAAFTWPKVSQYVLRQLKNRDVFHTDQLYIGELAAVFGAYTRYVLSETDIDLLIMSIQETIEKESALNKAAGIRALSRVVEEMCALSLFESTDHGVKLAEYISAVTAKLRKEPDDRPMLEAVLLLNAIVQANTEILAIPVLARKIVATISECCTHKNWHVKETVVRIITTEEEVSRMSPPLISELVKVAEACRYDKVDAVRMAARSLLMLLRTQVPEDSKVSRSRPQSSAVQRTWTNRPRPKSSSLEQRLDRPPNSNTLLSWVSKADSVKTKGLGEPVHIDSMAAQRTNSARAYTYVPTNRSLKAPPFRHCGGLVVGSSSTSSTASTSSTSSTASVIPGQCANNNIAECYRSRHMLRVLAEDSSLSEQSLTSKDLMEESPKAKTAIHCIHAYDDLSAGGHSP